MAINLGDAVVYIKYDDSALRGGITSSVNAVRGEMGGLTDFFTGSLQVAVGNLISGSITALGSAIATTAQGLTGFFAEGIKGAVDLDQQMSTIAALMGTTKNEIAPLKDLMYELALDPNLVVSATQAADAIQLLGGNGATVDQIMGGLAKSTIALANASGNDFALAANVASSAIGQFGFKAEESMSAFDSIVGLLSASKFTLNDYEQALANAGGIAAGMGVEFKDLNTTLVATQSYFASGAEAGTSFKTFLSRLAQPTGEMKALMTEYNISLYDNNGQLRGMSEIIDQLSGAMVGLTEEQKNNLALTLGGSDASRMVIALANTTTEEYAKLAEQVNASGNAFRTAATQVDSVQGAYDVFLGVIEAIQLQIGEAFLPALREMLIAFTDIAEKAAPAMIGFGKIVAEAMAGLVSNNIVPAINGAAEFVNTLVEIFQAQSLRTQFNILRDYIIENKAIFDGLFGAGFTDNLRAANDDIQRLIKIFGNEGLQGVANEFVNFAIAKFNELKPVVMDFVMGLPKALWDAVPLAVAAASDFIGQFFNGLVEGAGQYLPLANDVIQRILDALAVAIQGAAVFGARIFYELSNALISASQDSGNSQQMLTLGETLGKFIMNGVQSLLSNIAEILPALTLFVASLGRAAGALGVVIVKFGAELAAGLIKGMVEAMTGQELQVMTVDAFLDLIGKISKIPFGAAFIQASLMVTAEIYKTMIEIGAGAAIALIDGFYQNVTGNKDSIALAGFEMVNGVAVGITDSVSDAIDAIIWLGESIVLGFKQFFGIASPSALFAELAGELVAGLVEGLSEFDDVLSAIEDMASEIVDTLSEYLADAGDGIADSVSEWADYFDNSLNDILDLLDDIVSELVDIVDTWLSDTSDYIADYTSDWYDTLSDFWTNALDLAIDIISELTDTVSEWLDNKLSMMTEYADELYSVWEELWSDISDYASELLNDIIANFEDFYDNASGLFSDLSDELGELWEDAWDTIGGLLENGIAFVSGGLSSFYDLASSTFQSVRGVLTEVWDSAWAVITSVAATAFSTLETWFNSSKLFIDQLWNDLTLNLATAWEAAWNLIASIVNTVKSTVLSNIETWADDVFDKFDSVKTTVIAAWGALWEALPEPVRDGAEDVIELTKQFFSDMVKKANDFKNEWLTVGKNIIEGLLKGLRDNEESVSSYLFELAKKMVKSAMSALGIQSPSKEFAYIGQMTTEGLAVGVEEGSVVAIDAVGNMTASMVAMAEDTLSGLGEFMASTVSTAMSNAQVNNPFTGAVDVVLAQASKSFDELITRATNMVGKEWTKMTITQQRGAIQQSLNEQLAALNAEMQSNIASGMAGQEAVAKFKAGTERIQKEFLDKIELPKGHSKLQSFLEDATRQLQTAAEFAVTSGDSMAKFGNVFNLTVEASQKETRRQIESISVETLAGVQKIKRELFDETQNLASGGLTPIKEEWDKKFKDEILGGVEASTKEMTELFKEAIASGLSPEEAMKKYVEMSNTTFQLISNEFATTIPGVTEEGTAIMRKSYQEVVKNLDAMFIGQTKAKLGDMGKSLKQGLSEGLDFQTVLDNANKQFEAIQATMNDKMIQGMPGTVSKANALLNEQYQKMMEDLEKGIGSGIKDKLETAKNTFNDAIKSGLDPQAALANYNQTIVGLRSMLTDDIAQSMPEAVANAERAIRDSSDKLTKSLEKDFVGGVKNKLSNASGEFKQAIGDATNASQLAELVNRFNFALVDVQMGLKSGVAKLLPDAVAGAKEEIKQANESAANDLARAFNKSVKDGLKGGLDDIKKGLSEGLDPAMLMTNFNALVSNMQSGGDTVKHAIGNVFGQAIPKEIENLGVSLGEQTDKAKKIISEFIEAGVKDKLKGVGEAFKKELSEGGDVSKAMAQFKTTLAEVPSEFVGLADDALAKAQELAGKVLTGDIKEKLGAIKTDIKDLFEVGGTSQDAINNLKSNLAKVSETITTELATNAPSAVANATELLQATTKDSARKIADNVFNDIKDTLKKAGQTVKDGLKDGLDPAKLLADFNDTVGKLGVSSEQLKTQLTDNFGIALPKELAGSGELISAELDNVTKLVNEQVKKSQEGAGKSIIDDIKKNLALAQSELKNSVDFGGTAEQAIGDFAIKLAEMGKVITNELAINAPAKVGEANEILLSATRTAMRSLADASKKEFNELLAVESGAVKDSASDPARWAAFQEAMANQILGMNKDVVAAVPGVVDEAQEVMVRKVATMFKVTTAEAEAMLPDFLSKIQTMKEDAKAEAAPPIDIPNVTEAAHQAAENWNNVMTGMLTSAKVNIDDLKTPIATLPDFLKSTATLMLESGNELNTAFSSILSQVGETVKTNISAIANEVSLMLEPESEMVASLLGKATVLGSSFATALSDGFENGLGKMYNTLSQLQTDIAAAKSQLETPQVTSALAVPAEMASNAVEKVSNIVNEVVTNNSSKRNDFNVTINNPVPQKAVDDIMLLQALA